MSDVILKQTTKLRSYDLQSHGVEVMEEFDEQLPAVMGDFQQLQQVFLNMLNNAYDAIEESGPPWKDSSENRHHTNTSSRSACRTTAPASPMWSGFSIRFTPPNRPVKAPGSV